MECPNCGKQLCHGGDHDLEDIDESNGIVSNLSCLAKDCDTDVFIYTRFPDEETNTGSDSGSGDEAGEQSVP